MKIRNTILALLVTVLVVGCNELPVGPHSSPSFEQSTLQQVASTDLLILHSRGKVVGSLRVMNDEQNLYFDFNLEEGDDEVNTVYIHMAEGPDGFPRSRQGQLATEHFEHKFDDVSSDDPFVAIERNGAYEENGMIAIAVYVTSTIEGEQHALWAAEESLRPERLAESRATHFHYRLQEPDVTCENVDTWQFVSKGDREVLDIEQGGPRSYIVGESADDGYTFDGTYDFASYGTLDIAGSTMTVSGAPGLQVTQVWFLNTSDDNVSGFGGYERVRDEQGGAESIVIENVSFDEPYLYVRVQFAGEVCE